jgi:hypothetical protein
MRLRGHRRRSPTRGEARGCREDGPPAVAPATRPDSQLVKQHVTRLVVEVGNRAQSWRDAALDAELAFLWWQAAGQGERDSAAASYLAAIEREEKAASEYSRASEACCATLPEVRVSAARTGRNRRRWRLSYDDA